MNLTGIPQGWLVLGLLVLGFIVLRTLVHWLALLVAAWEKRRQPTYEPEHIETPRGGRLGRWGIVVTELAPRGKVRVQGVVWSAEAPAGGEPIGMGQEVEVLGHDGLVLAVRPAPVDRGIVVPIDR